MANMCQGDCRLGKTAPDNPYTHILQQADKDMALCCTPKKMKNLEMLYVDENNNVLVGNLPNMKVERCGCAWKKNSPNFYSICTKKRNIFSSKNMT